MVFSQKNIILDSSTKPWKMIFSFSGAQRKLTDLRANKNFMMSLE